MKLGGKQFDDANDERSPLVGGSMFEGVEINAHVAQNTAQQLGNKRPQRIRHGINVDKTTEIIPLPKRSLASVYLFIFLTVLLALVLIFVLLSYSPT
jgi:hypothetical protein